MQIHAQQQFGSECEQQSKQRSAPACLREGKLPFITAKISDNLTFDKLINTNLTPTTSKPILFATDNK